LLTLFQYETFQIAKESPLRLAPHPFWSIRVNDEGVGRPSNFFRLATAGKFEILAPHRAVSFGNDGRSIVLNDGKVVKADAVILCTGYQSSWTTIFDRQFFPSYYYLAYVKFSL
jgi:dimethylaniline monooxygenase (N-oxide forming)